MKKIITTIPLFFFACVIHAQGDYSRLNQSDVFKILASILFAVFVMLFILSILKRMLDNRLRNKIVDKGISESIAASVLKTHGEEDKNQSIKWFCILAGLGTGLLIVNYTQPIGYHSLAIMALSIALSFLGYYYFIRNKEGK